MQEQRLSLGTLLATVLLVALAALLCIYHLKDFDINTEPSARGAVLTREMNEAGAWLAPTVDGARLLDQPPLFLWATKLASQESLRIQEFHVRIPGALAGVAAILLVAAWFFIQAQRYGRDDAADVPPAGFALLAGLMFAASPLVILAARSGTPEAFEALFYLAAAFCWGESLEARRSFYAGRSWKQWLLWGYGFAALALLAGGVVPVLLLAVPYLLATRSYRLTRPSALHLVGVALLVGVLVAWLAAVGGGAAVKAGLAQWLTLRAGAATMAQDGVLPFLLKLLAATFPWNLIAGAMAVRIWRREERSPTLVFWMWSMLAGVVLLALTSPLAGARGIPVAAFVSLLAMQGLLRWHFESAWATRLRTLLRVALGLLIAFGLFLTAAIHSNLGLVLFTLLPLGWLVWSIKARSRGIIYTVWETTVRLSALTVVFAILAQAVIVCDFTPRRRYIDRTVLFFNRLNHHIDKMENVRIHRLGEQGRYLFDYHLFEHHQGRSLDTVSTATATFSRDVATTVPLEQWVVTQGAFDDAGLAPRAVQMVEQEKLREGGFSAWRIIPEADLASTETLRYGKLAARPPLRLAIMGNTGTRHRAQRDVAHRLDRIDRQRDEHTVSPIEDVLLLGNNVYGSSIWSHLDVIESFEEPYKRHLKNGVAFYAALGHEESPMARSWLQTQYPPFHMDGNRYYKVTLGGGLVDCFMLDSTRLFDKQRPEEAQWEWLEKALRESQAPWRIVGLWQALYTSSDGGAADRAAVERLLGLLDRFKVQAVFQSGGHWYEHIELPGHTAKIFNAGWSGEIEDTPFAQDPNVKVSYNAQPGFIVAEFRAGEASVKAINSKGIVIDETALEELYAPVTPPTP